MFLRAAALTLLLGTTASAQVAESVLAELRADVETTLGPLSLASVSALAPAPMSVTEFPVSRWHPDLLDRLFKGPRYLDPRTDYNLAAPPANGSAETLKELLDLLVLQRDARTSRDAFYVRIEDQHGLLPADLLFYHGMIPSPDEAPELWTLLDTVNEEALWFVLREKLRFSRPRPSDLEPGLSPLVPVPGHPSYPSGHATLYRAVFEVLGELVPECREAWRGMAGEIAHRREIAGLHFASDSAAGNDLGAAIARDLLEGGHLKPMFDDLTEAVFAREITKPTCDPV